MRGQSASEENHASALSGFPVSRAPWRVSEVSVRDGFILHVRFEDGLVGEVDLSRLLFCDSAGVFAELRDPSLFKGARVDGGVVVWPNGLDLAPDAMYRAIRKTGIFIPGTDSAA